LGATLSALTTPWLETYQEFSIPIGYPMVLALGLVAVVANVSSIERFWSIATAIRVREREIAQVDTRTAEGAVSEEQKGSQISHHAAGMQL
jgi:hypothetical protein